MPREGLGALAAACVGTVVVLAYALWAGWQILVLNPLAAVPGRTLGQIYADMAAANESHFLPIVWAVLSIGPALAAVFLILSVTIWRVGPWAAVRWSARRGAADCQGGRRPTGGM